MNRLLRISFDTLLTSLTPILGWFLLGISFMNMDIDTYKIFGTYGLIQMFLQLLLNLSLCKLYFEDENKRANKYSFLFNIINFSSLILLSIITKEQIIIAGITTIISNIFVAIMLFRQESD